MKQSIGGIGGWVVVGMAVMSWVAAPNMKTEGGALPRTDPYLVVLGIAQDGGVPQAGTKEHPAWTDPARKRRVVCLGLVDPVTGQRWLFEATPDLPEQLHRLDRLAPRSDTPGLDGVFLTHGHMGHYTGLMFLGHEGMGARNVPVYAMPRMADYLRHNGPWEQLVRYENITLHLLADGQPVRLNERLTVTPFRVPHRQEYTEVVGFRIAGPHRTVVFLPDIDSWEAWEAEGSRLEDVVAGADVLYLDATFYANGEIPGRDMTGFPHPFITHTMKRLAALPQALRERVRFIHLNHTNPALWPGTRARQTVEARGFRVAEEGEQVSL